MKKILIILLLTCLNCSSSKETLIADLDNEVVPLMYWSLPTNGINVFEKTNNEKYRNSSLQIYVNGNDNNEISILILNKTENELEKTQTIYIKDKEPFLIKETESELELNPLKPILREAKYYVENWEKSNFIVFTEGKYSVNDWGISEFILSAEGKKETMETKKIELQFLIELAEKYKSE